MEGGEAGAWRRRGGGWRCGFGRKEWVLGAWKREICVVLGVDLERVERAELGVVGEDLGESWKRCGKKYFLLF